MMWFNNNILWVQLHPMSCGVAPTAGAGKISNILPISNICPIGNIFPIGNI
jgi:hypothetical protein